MNANAENKLKGGTLSRNTGSKCPGILRKNGKGIYIRVHAKSMQKFKDTSRKSVQSIKPALARVKRCASGWLNYYGIADMKNPIEELNQWLCHRIRM